MSDNTDQPFEEGVPVEVPKPEEVEDLPVSDAEILDGFQMIFDELVVHKQAIAQTTIQLEELYQMVVALKMEREKEKAVDVS